MAISKNREIIHYINGVARTQSRQSREPLAARESHSGRVKEEEDGEKRRVPAARVPVMVHPFRHAVAYEMTDYKTFVTDRTGA